MTQAVLLCRNCGRSIGAPPFLRAGEQCCCENCFLDSRQSDVDQSVDAERHAFAEALAAALDMREMVQMKCATGWSEVP